MKLVHIYLFRLVAGITLFLMFVGCTHTIKSADISTLQTGSPLKGVGSKTFSFKDFKDIRGTDAFLITAIGSHKYTLDQPVATVVAMSIRKELERNGHKYIAYSTQSNPDFIIEGTVYKYSLTMQSGLVSNTIIGNAAVKLTISRASADREVLAKSYQGEYRKDTFGGPHGVLKAVSNQALLEMVKEMSTDPELIAFLEK